MSSSKSEHVYVKNLELIEALFKISQNAENIFIRTKIDGKWGAYHLLEIPYHELQTWLMTKILEKGVKND